jgi:hypothetical protein
MCAGGKLALPTPPVRHRSEQLQQRLAILQERLDSQRYAAMVADVTHDEQVRLAASLGVGSMSHRGVGLLHPPSL